MVVAKSMYLLVLSQPKPPKFKAELQGWAEYIVGMDTDGISYPEVTGIYDMCSECSFGDGEAWGDHHSDDAVKEAV